MRNDPLQTESIPAGQGVSNLLDTPRLPVISPLPMNAMSVNFWVVLHFFGLSGLCLYGIHRIWLLWCWQKQDCPTAPEKPAPGSADRTPVVTVQLPLFNERFVAARLIDAAARLDWPPEALDIQVLDDSTDDTDAIVAERIAYWNTQGRKISHIRRGRRDGFKAGALAYGLAKARGELIAIFDADFIPPSDFLKKTTGYFIDPAVGMIQARWTFTNAEHSWLTRLQQMLLAPHFDIEHRVRSCRSLFFNFNGTAGIWRRTAIEDAGGWESDTVTEDLDLSYRAQMKGWRFVYVSDPAVPSELPVTLAAFRTQQQRWAKGSIQTARKVLPDLLCSGLPLPLKLEAIAHLLANLGWLLGALVTLTLYPALLSRIRIGPWQVLWIDLPLFLLSGGAILFYFLFYALHKRHLKLIWVLPLLPALSIGLAPALAVSVVQGLFTDGGRFERTPKFGIASGKRISDPVGVYRQPVFRYLLINSALFLYMQFPLVFAVTRNTWPAIPFLCLLPAGFALVCAMDFLSLHGPAATRREMDSP